MSSKNPLKARVASGVAARTALVTGAMALAACAGTARWNALSIDGSSQPAFEESVAVLSDELPRKRRELFRIALAVVWIEDTLADNAGDIDQDGDVDFDDAEAVLRFAFQTQRQTLMAAIDRASSGKGSEPSNDYYRRLHGLGYEGVLALAGPGIADRYHAAYRAYWAPHQARMRELATRDGFSRPPPPPARSEPYDILTGEPISR